VTGLLPIQDVADLETDKKIFIQITQILKKKPLNGITSTSLSES
jgi:hypothetical protein